MANTGSGNVKNLCPLKKSEKKKTKIFSGKWIATSGILIFFIVILLCRFCFSGRTEEEVMKKAAERFNVAPEKITLKQGKNCCDTCYASPALENPAWSRS